jgi:hypothetical protein
VVSRGYNAGLALADAENLGPAFRAGALSGWPLVLKRDCLGILHFNFLPAFHAISLHNAPPKLPLPSRVAKLDIFVNSLQT